MASFYKRGDYQWEAKVRCTGHPMQSKTFETMADARVWAQQVEAEMRLGMLRSTRSLDLYLLLAYRLPQLSHPVTLSWEDVRCHLGSGANLSTRAGLAAFRAEIAECLRAVVYLYPKALVSVGLKGLTLRHSPPPISFSGSRVLH
jgi:hypothetical protein